MSVIFQLFKTYFLAKLFHRLNNISMKLLKLFMVQVIWLRLTIWASLREFVTLMTLLNLFGPLLLLIFFYLLNHLSCFLRHITVRFFSWTLLFSLLFFCSQRRVVNFSGLKFSLVIRLSLVIFFTFCPVRLKKFNFS